MDYFVAKQKDGTWNKYPLEVELGIQAFEKHLGIPRKKIWDKLGIKVEKNADVITSLDKRFKGNFAGFHDYELEES